MRNDPCSNGKPYYVAEGTWHLVGSEEETGTAMSPQIRSVADPRNQSHQQPKSDSQIEPQLPVARGCIVVRPQPYFWRFLVKAVNEGDVCTGDQVSVSPHRGLNRTVAHLLLDVWKPTPGGYLLRARERAD